MTRLHRFSSLKAIALAAALSMTAGLAIADSKNVSSDQILNALQPKPLTRSLSAAPQARTRCLTGDGRITAIYATIEVAAPMLVDASPEAPSDIVEGCWKSTLIALGLIDRNIGPTPTDSPTLTTMVGTLADATPEQPIATTTTLG